MIHEAAFRKLFDERAVRAAMTRANGRHNLHVLEKALELNAAGQRRHQAASSKTASSLLQADPACPNRSSTPKSKTSRSTSTGRT